MLKEAQREVGGGARAADFNLTGGLNPASDVKPDTVSSGANDASGANIPLNARPSLTDVVKNKKLVGKNPQETSSLGIDSQKDKEAAGGRFLRQEAQNQKNESEQEPLLPHQYETPFSQELSLFSDEQIEAETEKRRAGRPKGAPNKRNQDVLKLAQAHGLGDPMLGVLRIASMSLKQIVEESRAVAKETGVPLGGSVTDFAKIRLNAILGVLPYAYAKRIPITSDGDDALPMLSINLSAPTTAPSGFAASAGLVSDQTNMTIDLAALASQMGEQIRAMAVPDPEEGESCE